MALSHANPARLFRTVQHLRPSQVYGQMRLRIGRRLENEERFSRQAVPPWPGVRWRPRDQFLPPGAQCNSSIEILAGKLTFLDETHAVGWPPQWNELNQSKLWLYNLHYFEYLWALEYEPAKRLVEDWIEGHNLSRGRVGWDPYPVSLRLENLCGIFFAKYRSQIEHDVPFRDLLWQSVYLQTQWLGQRLETHLLANHLLENGIALAFVGACFDGDSARRSLEVGLGVLKRQLPEQILPDGGHFERSPMYQTRIAYALALLANTDEPAIRNAVQEPLRRMLGALRDLCHPDDHIALLNDSSLWTYNRPADVFAFAEGGDQMSDRFGEEMEDGGRDTLGDGSWEMEVGGPETGIRHPASGTAQMDSCESGCENGFAHQPGLPSPTSDRLTNNDQRLTISDPISHFALPQTGYYGARVKHNAGTHYVLCDAGEIGPDYNPGHAHGDIFSFELSLFGHRVIVDSGNFDYEPSAMRRYCRSTGAHNTVSINELDQCEFWGTFRVGRRGRPHDVRWQPGKEGFRLSGWHDGYRWLSGSPTHHRQFVWHGLGVLMVRDTVEAKVDVDAVSRLHLHPDCEVVEVGDNHANVRYPAGHFQVLFAGGGTLNTESASYCPEFGKRMDNVALVFSCRSRRVLTGFCIAAVDIEYFQLEQGAKYHERTIEW